ncbi:hypothetical protein H4R18_003371 [Coemansia javaensis]|uniref:Uncharacterized protein n=1 Tax=Coemansia javaensis TaxID=2761396 RepID=A0A9W8LGF9_9FUNG|nr:hypothetical protein H4R18_003371 [Coemansia javaensis]
MPPLRRSQRLARATTRTVVEVVIEQRVSRPPAQSTLDALAAAAQTSRGWRARVTECADRAYSAERGRIDWEAAAAQLGLPLVGCLYMFDPSQSTIAVRPLPSLFSWSREEDCALRDFVASNFGLVGGDTWRLAGVYMNLDRADCLAAYCRTKRMKITPGVCESMRLYREDGVSWEELHGMFPVYASADVLLNMFHSAASRYSDGLDDGTTLTKWTPAETERIREIVMRLYTPGCMLPVFNAVAYTFPGMPREMIKGKVSRIVYREGIAKAAMAAAERDTATGASAKAGTWTLDEAAMLEDLVAGYKGGKIDWTAISAAMGREPHACWVKYGKDSRRKVADPRQEQADAVDAEARRQHELRLGIDWAAVSRTVGLSELDCLEICRFDKGKVSWTYDPDTFSRERADRMEAFIAQNYPPPQPPNFHAVSNYMWTNADDCIRMVRMLRGEFEWTDEAKARLARMRKRGMSFEEIARQLSPSFTAERVCAYYTRMAYPEARTPLTAEEKQRVKDIVHENAGKVPLDKILQMARALFSDAGRRRATNSCVSACSTVHPFYKARWAAADRDQIAQDILSGTTTVAAVAQQLDVPSYMVTTAVYRFESAKYPSAWTVQETELLLEFVRTHSKPYKWASIAALIGTKSPTQCRCKYGNQIKRAMHHK